MIALIAAALHIAMLTRPTTPADCGFKEAFRMRVRTRLATRLFVVCCAMQSLSVRPSHADWPNPDVLAKRGALGQHVNVMIGTGGAAHLCGNNFPGATLPFGMVRLSPDTISSAGRKASNSSGYFYSDPKLLGFSHTRLAGTGATDGGNFLVIPTNAELAKQHRTGLNLPYSHRDEIAFPGYYGVALPKLGITAEMTATHRVGIHRYTFPADQAPRVLIDVTSVLGRGSSKAGEVKILPEAGEVEGSVQTFGTFAKRYGGLKTYFVAKFSRPMDEFATWTKDSEAPRVTVGAGDDLGVDLTFKKDPSDSTLVVKLAISYVSIENARLNLLQEAVNGSFDDLLTAAVLRWEEKFSLIRVDGGTGDQRTIFYTGLYHSFQMPTAFNDVNGEYFGFDQKTHRVDGFRYFTDMSLWDTFRTVHPLYTLIAPLEQRDMIVSILKMADQGGYLPRWPSGAGYTNSMFGSPADMLIAESYLKGIRGFDAEAALGYMKKTALQPVPQGSPSSGRVGIEHYLKYEFCPGDLMKKSVASTIEYCYADHSIARLAEALGHQDDAELFNKHARYYRNLFNPETQFFQARNSDGKFQAEFQPEMLTYVDVGGKFTHAYVEGSAWQWRWGVPSDADEVIKLFKSREYFVSELNQFFERAPQGVSVIPNAYYWHGNQPDIYAAYLFNHAGRPDLTQKWVRWILESKYGVRDNGVDGNDDGGTLSAWYVLSSIGIYPTAGTDRYELASPIWSKAEVKILDKTLTIVADNAAPDHPYVHKVWLNDQLLDRTWIRHEEIVNGGTLRFEMSKEPVKQPE